MNAYRAYDVIEERKWAEQTLSEEKQKWVDDRAQEIIDALPKEPSGLFRFSVPMDKSPYEGLRSDSAGEAYNVSFRQLLTPRRNTTGNTVPAARFNFGE